MMFYSLICFLISICIILLILFLIAGNVKTKIRIACAVPFIFVVFFFILFFNKNIILSLHDIKVDFFGNIGSYLGGVFGTIFTMFTTGLLIYQIYKQQIITYKKDITDKFYKHLDIHMHDLFALKVKNVIIGSAKERSEGRRVFVVFRIQIKYIIQTLEALPNWSAFSKRDQMKIVFVIFYHGYSEKWKDDFKEIMMSEVLIGVDRVDDIISLLENNHLKMMKDKNGNSTKVNITRTNLTTISSYFENMFFAINLIDKAEYFDLNEKRNLVDMFVCQLSEPEKFIFFFYLNSSFGEKWKNEKLFNYNLLSGLTKRYCFVYDPDILQDGIASSGYLIKN